MSLCPVCNGFSVIKKQCSSCHNLFIDFGRVNDYIDKYSAYEEIDIINLDNQISHDHTNQLCTHYLYCKTCQETEIILLKEK